MSNSFPTQTLHLPIGSIDAYISRVNQIPLLSLEEEQIYATRFAEEEDVEAARQLVLPHLRYVVRVARGYLGYGLPLGDLIQEGNIGLMKAVKRFNPTYGVRLVSFAVHWIKAEIHEFILKNWRIVKIATTKAQRKLFFNLRSMKDRLGWFTQEEVAAVAEDLGVSCKEVLAMEQRLNAMDAAFDSYHDDEDSLFLAPAETLIAPNSDPAEILINEDSGSQSKEALLDALADLDERSRDILQKRWLQDKKATLQELAAFYDISPERIRQLEQSAMKKLRAAIGVTHLH